MDICVLYIVGAGRSGSTLLEMVLGNLPGFFSVGEVRYFWEYWQAEDRLCGCGQPLKTCDFWGSVSGGLERAEINTAQMADWASRYDRTRNLPRLARENGRFWPAPFITGTAQLYQMLQSASGAAAIVDSSKVPSHLYLLKQIPVLDLRVLHLVRDGRAVAYSWNKRRKKESGSQNEQTMPAKSLVKALTVWTIENRFAQLAAVNISRYTQLRYEDFVSDPSGQLGQALTALGWPGVDLAHLDKNSFFMQPTHRVGGNPLRFSQKVLHIRADNTWQERMPKWQQLGLGLLALPSLRRYGYPLQ